MDCPRIHLLWDSLSSTKYHFNKVLSAHSSVSGEETTSAWGCLALPGVFKSRVPPPRGQQSPCSWQRARDRSLHLNLGWGRN